MNSNDKKAVITPRTLSYKIFNAPESSPSLMLMCTVQKTNKKYILVFDDKPGMKATRAEMKAAHVENWAEPANEYGTTSQIVIRLDIIHQCIFRFRKPCS
jgi:hypothetical protein